ncbi:MULTISPECIES: SDR family oxidoreductase [unclassified Paenibacillus]|nr:SDR family oxidoreductase [Paenibacillus sp. RC334]
MSSNLTDLGYNGKVVVITGCATGIGKATAQKLIGLGAQVYALDIKEPQFKVKQYIPIDMGSKTSIEQAVGALPDTVDFVFNCAGIAGTSYAGKTFTPKQVMNINFVGVKHFVELIKEKLNPHSAIAIVASVAAFAWEAKKEILLPLISCKTYEEAQNWLDSHLSDEKVMAQKPEENGVYFLSKEALVAWVKYVAMAYSEQHIRINTISPGATNTAMTEDFNIIFKKVISEDFTSVAGIATPEDQANALLLINSSLSSYISGQDIQVDFAGATQYLFHKGE